MKKRKYDGGGKMTTQFDIKRLVEVALADERSGVALYQNMVDKAVDDKLKHVFINLSETEKAHAAKFEQMVEDLKEDPPQGAYPDEYAEYLDALCAEGGDSDAYARIAQTTTDTELLDLAIEFEKEQLTIQRDIGDALGGGHKEVVDVILKEEQNHLVVLSRVKKQLGL
jgi:rubrerythrin